MNAPLNLRLDKPTFLKWVQERHDARYELEAGEVIVHAGGTLRHSETASQFVIALGKRLSVHDWIVTGSDFAIDAVNSIRFPDFMVARRGLEGDALSTCEPVVLVEVPSQGSNGRMIDVSHPASLGRPCDKERPWGRSVPSPARASGGAEDNDRSPTAALG